MRLLEDGTGDAAGEPVSAEAAVSAKREHGVEDGRFAVALVGKDGGVKFRADEPVPAREIFGRIDAMPMRRREMREGTDRITSCCAGPRGFVVAPRDRMEVL